MKVKAVEKYIRISPKKARLVADVVRGQNANKALIILKFMPKKGAKIIFKALKSAISNAVNNFNLNGEDLVISKITVDGGPVLKRFRPGARGMAKHIRKRTSHITVVVSDSSEVVGSKKQVASNTRNSKLEIRNSKSKPEAVRSSEKEATKEVKAEGSEE